MKIACSGSIAYDYLMTFPGYFCEHILPDKLDSISLSFLVDSMVRQRGGTAANIAFTLALFGNHPALVGTVGEDFNDYRAWLESKGVDTQDVRVIPGKFTASFFANTDLANNQICSFYPGAMAHASEIGIGDLAQRPDLVIISPDDPGAMLVHADQCTQLGIPYVFDPSQQIIRMSGEALRRGVANALSVFVNEYEYELLQKRTGLTEKEIHDHVHFTVVTYGEKGALVFTGGHTYSIPIVPAVCIVDPTGVGDAFRAGFLTGYRMGLDWETCGKVGALCASYCLEQKGTQNHQFTMQEFVARFRQHFDDQGALDQLLA